MAKTAQISIDDTVLVRQCRDGDSEATGKLILKYQDRIYNTILKICANHDDAAELTQDTFVKVIENIGKFEARSSFYTWIFRIAVNLTLNYCQRKVKLGLKSLDAEISEHDTEQKALLKQLVCDENSPDPAVVAANSELFRLIEKALTKLDEPQRTVVVLRDIEGMNYAQIAEVLGLELGTVKSRLSRGRNNLREILEAVSQ